MPIGWRDRTCFCLIHPSTASNLGQVALGWRRAWGVSGGLGGNSLCRAEHHRLGCCCLPFWLEERKGRVRGSSANGATRGLTVASRDGNVMAILQCTCGISSIYRYWLLRCVTPVPIAPSCYIDRSLGSLNEWLGRSPFHSMKHSMTPLISCIKHGVHIPEGLRCCRCHKQYNCTG